MNRSNGRFWLSPARYTAFIRSSRRRRVGDLTAGLATLVAAYLLRATYWCMAAGLFAEIGHYLWSCWAAARRPRREAAR